MRCSPRAGIPILASLIWLPAACLPEPDRPMDEATVLSDNTSVRIDAASSARTLYTLDAGDRVSILEKRDTWYLVRDTDLLEGWMDETTLLRDTTREAMSAALGESAGRPVQNTARTREAANLRLVPGRDTDVIRRLRRGTEIEVLDRTTTANPDGETIDVWFQVRPSAEEIGWVYGPLTAFDIPEAILRYTEGREYPAVFPLRQVEDPVAGPRTWYLVAERRPGADPQIAFDGIRVFVWSLTTHDYATTLRLPNVRGVYPIEVTEEGDERGFRVPLLAADGSVTVREYVMRGTVPREVP